MHKLIKKQNETSPYNKAKCSEEKERINEAIISIPFSLLKGFYKNVSKD